MSRRKHPKLPIEQCLVSRRAFLRGAGGVTLSLPFLASLAPRSASAQAAPYDKVIFVVFSHGLYQPWWYPEVATSEVEPGVRAGSLASATMGMYLGSSFDALRSKVTMLRGLSQIGGWGHATPVALSASGFPGGRVDGDPIVGTYPSSVDNVLADSGKVYGTLRGDQLDVLRLSMAGAQHTHSYRNFRNLECIESSEVAFDRMFPNGVARVGGSGAEDPSATTRADARKRARRRLLMVDSALEQYRTLRESAALSSDDRALLDQTIEHYAELERGLSAEADGEPVNAATSTCEPFSVGGSNDAEDHIRLFTQGLGCGVTRIGYWRLPSSHANEDGSHQASSSANASPSGPYTRIMRDNCRRVADLMAAMDGIVEGNGQTMLDNSLVVFTSDLGSSVYGADGHTGIDAPFLIGGTLGDKFRTGLLVDYTDRTERGHLANIKGYDLRGGPPHNELLISIMKGFGLGPSDWEVGGQPGFGAYDCERENLCTAEDRGAAQPLYVRYYRDVYRSSRPPGQELSYYRRGA